METGSDGDCIALQMCLMPLNCKLKNGYNGNILFLFYHSGKKKRLLEAMSPFVQLITVRVTVKGFCWASSPGTMDFRILRWRFPVKLPSRSCLKHTNPAAGSEKWGTWAGKRGCQYSV